MHLKADTQNTKFTFKLSLSVEEQDKKSRSKSNDQQKQDKVTLNKKYKGPDQKVSIDFSDLNNLIKGLRLLEKSFGSKKKVQDKEKQIRKWATRSIVTIKDIKKGEKFTINNLWTKRPGIGIPSKNLYKIIGKKSKKNIKTNSLLKISDIK